MSKEECIITRLALYFLFDSNKERIRYAWE